MDRPVRLCDAGRNGNQRAMPQPNLFVASFKVLVVTMTLLLNAAWAQASGGIINDSEAELRFF